MDIAEHLELLARGELEITDVNLEYLRQDKLQVIPLDKDFTRLDASMADSLLVDGEQIRQTGHYVGCLEGLGLNED